MSVLKKLRKPYCAKVGKKNFWHTVSIKPPLVLYGTNQMRNKSLQAQQNSPRMPLHGAATW